MLPRDLCLREILTLAPLAVLCIVLGLYPTPVLRSLESPIAAALYPTRAYLLPIDSLPIPEGFDVSPTSDMSDGTVPIALTLNEEPAP